MIDDKYLELIHGEIDGVNSARQSAQLWSHLSAHPKARQLYEELRTTSAMLQEVKAVEPPTHLQHAIMSALPLARPAPVTHSFIAAAREWLSEKLEIKHAFSFAGGLAAGVLLFALLRPLSQKAIAVDPTKLYGTIGALQAGANRAEQKRWDIQQPEVTGTIVLQNAGAVIHAVIALNVLQPVDLSISFDQKTLAFKGLMRGEGEAAPAEIALRAESIKLTHSGKQEYTIIFEKQAAPALEMRFQFQRAGQLLYENKIGF